MRRIRTPARSEVARAGLETVAIHGLTDYNSATTVALPEAVAVADPFRVVALAGDALDR